LALGRKKKTGGTRPKEGILKRKGDRIDHLYNTHFLQSMKRGDQGKEEGKETRTLISKRPNEEDDHRGRLLAEAEKKERKEVETRKTQLK